MNTRKVMKMVDRILQKIKKGKYEEVDDDVLIGLNICPDCYTKMEQKMGCKDCPECGFSVCG